MTLSAYAEQEELEKLKAWWKHYGNALLFGVALGAAILFGVHYWNQHRERSLGEASALYQQMLQDQRAKKLDSARQAGDKLLNDYAATPYAAMAGLVLARLDHDAGDAAGARTRLQWVLDHAKDAAAEQAARLRLARLYASSGEHERALSLIEAKQPPGFESEYLELKGDIFSALGRKDEARQAYREAIQHLSNGSAYAPVLTMKLDDLGPG